MTRWPPRAGEWLLTKCGAPEALLGDLHEGHVRRGGLWYWQQVGAFLTLTALAAVTHHPLRAVWWLAMTGILVVAVTHIAQIVGQPASAVALVADVESTGWVATTDTDGPRVVPAVRVRVTNRTSENVAGVEVNAVFRRAVDDIEWGNHWRPIAGRGELAPGTASEIVLVTSAHGHVGGLSATAILHHPRFVDARVEVFARHGAQPWARLAELPVSRQIIEP